MTQSTLRYLTAPPIPGQMDLRPTYLGTPRIHVAQWRGTKLFSAMYSETCVILVESGVAAVLHHLSYPRCWRTGWCDSLVTCAHALLVLDDFSAKFRRRKGAQALGNGWEGRVL